MSTADPARLLALHALKIRVGRHVDRATAVLVQAWAAAYQQILGELFDATVDAAAYAIATGGQANPAAYRTTRLLAALQVAENRLRSLGLLAGLTVSRAAPGVVDQVTVAFHAMALEGIAPFSMPRPVELDAIVRRTTQRITSLTLPLSLEADQAVRAALVSGVARGAGPRDVARQMVNRARAAAAARYGIDPLTLAAQGRDTAIVAEVRGAFNGGLNRALTISRTELIDASRYATTALFEANRDLVTGWRWLASLDGRTCPACWAMHDSVHALSEHQEGHQNCRCTQYPVLAGDAADARLGDPAATFARLSAQAQLEVMGPTRLAWLKSGGDFRRLAQRRHNDGWRAGHYSTAVKDLPPPGRSVSQVA